MRDSKTRGSMVAIAARKGVAIVHVISERNDRAMCGFVINKTTTLAQTAPEITCPSCKSKLEVQKEKMRTLETGTNTEGT